MNTKDYYASTAYNSQSPRRIDKIPITAEKFPAEFKSSRQRPLPKINLPELFFLSSREMGEPYYFLHEKVNKRVERNLTRKLAEYDERAHAVIAWPGFTNPASLLCTVAIFLKFMPCWTFIGIIFLLFLTLFKGEANKITFSFLAQFIIPLMIAPYLLSKILKFIARFLPDKKYTVFSRRTGMITIPGKKKEIVVPFDEFDPYVEIGYAPSGRAYQTLWYMHRYSTYGMCIGMNESWPSEMLLTHQYYQQFMDISKPLPDVPKLEAYRHLDPVTAEYDRKTGRPKDYWKSKTKEEIDKMLVDIRKETKKINELEFL